MSNLVMENIIDVKENESCNTSDATIKRGNKIKNLQGELEIMTNITIKDQKRKKLENV